MGDAVSLVRGRSGATAASLETLGSRRVALVRWDSRTRRGALQPQDGATIALAAHQALRLRIPLVLMLSSSGVDIRGGLAALHGWGVAARALTQCSGVVPVLAAVDGPAISGVALLLGLADHAVFTEESYAYVSGPAMVEEFTGATLSSAELGGAASHARSTGVAALIVATSDDFPAALGDLLEFFPDHTDSEPARSYTGDPAQRRTPGAGAILPASPSGSYDVRDVVAEIVDDAYLLELRAGWASNLVTAFARLDGRAVGIVANQPRSLAGTLDIPASQKGARFVAFCDAFNLPLVTFVDTPGFYPGKDLEWRGMIRHGAQLAFAYARATVPRVCLALRKSYGGAYIVMDSRHMGSDLYLAWPAAEIAVMGAGQASAVLMRQSDPATRASFEADYERRLLNPWVAASRGSVDSVIEPADSRAELCAALDVLISKRERLGNRRHDNSPL